MILFSLLNLLAVFLLKFFYQKYWILFSFYLQALRVIREKCATIIKEIEVIETGGLATGLEMEEEQIPQEMEEEE